MDPIICEERHKNINETLSRHERRMNNHSERLDKIEQINARLDERLSGLIKQVEGLNRILKWFIGLMVGAFIGFFFYIVQTNIMGG
ncbi:MAG TPA: hypothetical protein DHN33_03050 [Eubacteriaceae bacterium]|nr:hypothetical protein [Eubacteriaceae bacterium]